MKTEEKEIKKLQKRMREDEKFYDIIDTASDILRMHGTHGKVLGERFDSAMNAVIDFARVHGGSMNSRFYDVRDVGFTTCSLVKVEPRNAELTLTGFWARSRGSVLEALMDIMGDRRFWASLLNGCTGPDSYPLRLAEALMDRPGMADKTALKLLGAIREGGATREESLEITFISNILKKGRDSVPDTDGNSCWPAGNLEATTAKFLGKSTSEASDFLEMLRKAGIIVKFSDGSWATAIGYLAAERIVGMVKGEAGHNEVCVNPDGTRTGEQVAAFERAFSRGRVGCVDAAGGTGKTDTTAVILRDYCEGNPGSTVGILTPTGVAAKTLNTRMPAGINLAMGEAWTIDRAICSAKYPKKLDLLVIDEASMLSEEQLIGLPEADRYLFTGDALQLPPVEVGHPFLDLTTYAPTGTMTMNMRAMNAKWPLNELLNGQRKGVMWFTPEYSADISFSGLAYLPGKNKSTGLPWTAPELMHEVENRAKDAMYYALEDAYLNGWAVTSIRKDIMCAVQRYFLSRPPEPDMEDVRDLKRLATCIHALALVPTGTAKNLFRDVLDGRGPLDFKPGQEIVWASARVTSKVSGQKEPVYTYTGEVGRVEDALDDGGYILQMDNGARIEVPADDCRVATNMPFCLRWVRNTHRFQSEAAPEVLFITDVRTVSEGGKWVSFVDLRTAYTACSRAQFRYHVFPVHGRRGAAVQNGWVGLRLRMGPARNTVLSCHQEFFEEFPKGMLTGTI